jgi:hypothetical protein
MEKIVENHLRDDYIKNIYRELTKADQAEWLTVGVKAVLQFAFQIFISALNGFVIENGTLFRAFSSSLNV